MTINKTFIIELPDKTTIQVIKWRTENHNDSDQNDADWQWDRPQDYAKATTLERTSPDLYDELHDFINYTTL